MNCPNLDKKKRSFKEISKDSLINDNADDEIVGKKKKNTISKKSSKTETDDSKKKNEREPNTNVNLSSQKEENSDKEISISNSQLELLLDDFVREESQTSRIQQRPKITCVYYINKNKLTVEDLKDGRRIFNNKTQLSGYSGFNEHFLEFRQLLFENLLLNEDFTENLNEKWTLESSIFSTFCYDPDFIEPLIIQRKIKTLIVKHQEEKAYSEIEENGEYITFVHPKIDFSLKWGKFHSKLILLKFPNFLRVVVPSANLTNADWYYWGQVIWFQDFYPKKKTASDSNDFEIYLETVIESMMPKKFKEKRYYTQLGIDLKCYDFSRTCVDLIASASGRYANSQKETFGIGRLHHLSHIYSSQRESLKKTNSRLIVQCSSIGKSLRDKFLTDLTRGFFCKPPGDKTPAKIEIIYPTEDYINSFPMGRELSSCLFLGDESFKLHKSKFKRFELLKEHQNRKTIFHSKCFISSGEGEITVENISDNTIFYFGSHNLSVAAWGNFEKGDSQVSMSNYEMGIIFNPIKLRWEEKQNILKSLLMDINAKFYSSEDRAFIQDFF